MDKHSVSRKRLIERMGIIARRSDLTRQGLKSAFVSYDSSYRVRERQNVKVIPSVESTTFKSPLTSQVYFSVFCEGNRTEKDHVVR